MNMYVYATKGVLHPSRSLQGNQQQALMGVATQRSGPCGRLHGGWQHGGWQH